MPDALLQDRLLVFAGGGTGDEEKIIGPGEVFHIPPETEHGGGEYLEDMEVIVCKDVVPGWSLKNARWENKQ